MKKLLAAFAAEMVRPTLYQAFRRGVIALTAVLVWERYINHGASNGLSNGLFVAGIVFLGLAWFTYLRMDGLSFHYMLEERRTPKKKRHAARDMVDFADEHIPTLDELSDEERQLCSLLSSLLLMLLFFLSSFLTARF